ncbi:MAG: AAA family ATPase [Polyangiaceae bacterium]|nr:AAA family ATPase [Polyangiaceae bacterium]
MPPPQSKKATVDTSPERVLRLWVERDLTEAATLSELPPAFGSDDHVRRISEVIASGHFPILTGESGVGKTALIHELCRRQAAGQGPAQFEGRSVLQISIRTRLAGIPKKEQIGKEMQALVEALVAKDGTIVPFFRDIALAYLYDLEAHLESLALRFKGPILAEGDAPTIARMMENTPDLERRWLTIEIEEPDPIRTGSILTSFAELQSEKGVHFTPEALASAISLSDRFLSRTRQPRKSLDLLSSVAALTGKQGTLTREHVLDRFHDTFKVPRLLIDPTVPFDPEEAERFFRSRVLGQAEAARAVVHMISLIKAGLSDYRRPFGSFLFVGPTGVGKTHLAQLLAEYLFGSRERMVRLNMADYPDAGDAATVFGDPNGYTMAQKRGVLHARVAGHPFAVLLLDELEKAHEKIHDRFLQLLDEGAFINGAGETVLCRSTIVIATSNAGAEVYRGQPIGFGGKSDIHAMDRELDRLLYQHFRFEFLNRFDHVVHFHPLGRDDIRTIAQREIDALRQRSGFREHGHTLEVDEAVLDWLSAHGYDPHFGARFLKRAIERNVSTAIAHAVVRAPTEGAARIRLGVRGGKIQATIIHLGADTPKVEAIRVPEGKTEKVRTLDRKALVNEAEMVIERAQVKLQELTHVREQTSAKLREMSAPGFWDHRVEAQRTLSEYRALDVRLQQLSRWAEALEALPGVLDAFRERGGQLQPLGRSVERALAALRAWDEQVLISGSSAVWLLIRNADALQPAAGSIEDMGRMYLAWCAHLSLDAELCAFGQDDGVLSRLVLSVEGLGAAPYLAMEQGIHRFVKSESADERVRVDVIAAQSNRPEKLPAARGTGGKSTLEPLGLVGRYSMRVDRQAGLWVEWFGPNADSLSALGFDMGAALDWQSEANETARIYGHGGTGARDPRTRAIVVKYRDVLRGRLDPLLEAWRRAAAEPSHDESE